MSPTDPTGQGPGTSTSNPAISGVGTGMGTGKAADVGQGVQAGTVNDAAQGTGTGDAADPSLGSGMAVPEQDNRMGDAATGGAAGMEETPLEDGGAPIEPTEQPNKVVGPANRSR